MRLLTDMSIKWKLTRITMATSLGAVALACAAFAVYEFISFRNGATRHVSMLADIIASHRTASAGFDEPGLSEDLTPWFSREPQIISACAYGNDGRIVMRYLRAGLGKDVPLPAVTEDEEQRIADGHLDIFQPVIANGKKLGTLYVESDLRDLY